MKMYKDETYLIISSIIYLTLNVILDRDNLINLSIVFIAWLIPMLILYFMIKKGSSEIKRMIITFLIIIGTSVFIYYVDRLYQNQKEFYCFNEGEDYCEIYKFKLERVDKRFYNLLKEDCVNFLKYSCKGYKSYFYYKNNINTTEWTGTLKNYIGCNECNIEDKKEIIGYQYYDIDYDIEDAFNQ